MVSVKSKTSWPNRGSEKWKRQFTKITIEVALKTPIVGSLVSPLTPDPPPPPQGSSTVPPTSVTQVQLWLGSYVGWVSVDLNLTRRVFLRVPVLQFSSLLKIDSRPIPSGCGAVLIHGSCSVAEGLAGSNAPSVQPCSAAPLVIQSSNARKGYYQVRNYYCC